MHYLLNQEMQADKNQSTDADRIKTALIVEMKKTNATQY